MRAERAARDEKTRAKYVDATAMRRDRDGRRGATRGRSDRSVAALARAGRRPHAARAALNGDRARARTRKGRPSAMAARARDGRWTRGCGRANGGGGGRRGIAPRREDANDARNRR
jgi:hypothetical protein